MAVESLGPIDPVASMQGAGRTAPTPPRDIAESANLSTEDLVVSELLAARETANASPDARLHLVSAARDKLIDPNYLNPKVINRIAERIQEPFGT